MGLCLRRETHNKKGIFLKEANKYESNRLVIAKWKEILPSIFSNNFKMLLERNFNSGPLHYPQKYLSILGLYFVGESYFQQQILSLFSKTSPHDRIKCTMAIIIT